MKTIYLVRHAKSSWDGRGISDFERPLNHRGKNDAPLMGRKMKEYGIFPDLIISSPAKRAIQTAKIFANEMGYPDKNIKKIDNLYLADVDTFLEEIQKTDNDLIRIMLFSHNPGITELSNLMSNSRIDNIPTSGVVALEFKEKSWKLFGEKKCKFVFFEYPRKYYSV